MQAKRNTARGVLMHKGNRKRDKRTSQLVRILPLGEGERKEVREETNRGKWTL